MKTLTTLIVLLTLGVCQAALAEASDEAGQQESGSIEAFFRLPPIDQEPEFTGRPSELIAQPVRSAEQSAGWATISDWTTPVRVPLGSDVTTVNFVQPELPVGAPDELIDPLAPLTARPVRRPPQPITLTSAQPPEELTEKSRVPLAADNKQTLGKAPIDFTQQFLRTQAVLLKEGQWQFDVGADYATIDNLFPAFDNNFNLIQARTRRRLLFSPLQFRYGLTDRAQLFTNIPIGVSITENSIVGAQDIDSYFGTGDLNTGISYHLRSSSGAAFDPDIIVTGGFVAGLAKASFVSAFASPQTSLGQGFWGGFWNVLCVQRHDPVTLFYGFGGRHLVGKQIDGVQVQPGQQFNYQLGAGFAVNERVTLSTTFFGIFITEPYLNQQRLAGAIFEPMYLRFAATVSRPCNKIVEPFAQIGITNDSARAIIGVTWTYY